MLKKRYNLPAQSTAAANSTVAVAEFQGQYYKDSDIAEFSTACGVSPAVKIARNVGKNENTAGIESELDIEFIGAVSNPIPLAVWYSAEYSLLAWVQSVASNSAPGHIHSVSYGNDEVQQTSTAYMQQVNTQFMQAGAKGISILFASGDQGVWGRSGHGTKFHPDFPGASPYITTVGGTDFATYGISTLLTHSHSTSSYLSHLHSCIILHSLTFSCSLGCLTLLALTHCSPGVEQISVMRWHGMLAVVAFLTPSHSLRGKQMLSRIISLLQTLHSLLQASTTLQAVRTLTWLPSEAKRPLTASPPAAGLRASLEPQHLAQLLLGSLAC